MAQESKQIKVAANGGLYIARLDAEPEMPDDVESTLDSAFNEVGYASEDGVTFNFSEETEDIMAWQAINPVRKIVVSRNFSATITLEQWNRDTVSLAFGGGEWTEPENGLYKFVPPADYDPVTEWAAVIEAKDGDRIDRWVIERCTITGDIETQAVRNAPMMLPITISALTPDGKDRPWEYYSNDEAYEATGS